MSRTVDDPEYDIELTLSNGRLSIGPNTHPATIVQWVAACFLRPERVMTDECGETWTGAMMVERYLLQADEAVTGVSAAELAAAVHARWGGR